MEELYFGPSKNQPGWRKALQGRDDSLLSRLVESEPPGVTYLQIAGYINGLHRAGQMVADWKAAGIGAFEADRPELGRVLPIFRSIRRRLGWRQRELDIGFMRMVRQSSALSVVIGAGVTKGAGGPNWAELVRLIIQIALTKGHEVSQMVENAPGAGTGSYVRHVVRVERFSPETEAQARAILATIEKHKSNTDTETLKRGIQLCSNLFGQHLFTHLTGILYGMAPQPSATHRAIAELARAQDVPERGGEFPGWDAIITYNFDDLMGEALTATFVPYNIWAQTKRGVMGKPGFPALLRKKQVLPVFHLHGFTPRELFLITDIEFVFSTLQYSEIYTKETPTIIDKVLDEYLANPVHLALYVGCSFIDEAMNALLTKAAQRYPGRFHFALLKWPTKRGNSEPSPEEMESQAARYLQMGLQPVWYDDVEEIPDIIRSLK